MQVSSLLVAPRRRTGLPKLQSRAEFSAKSLKGSGQLRKPVTGLLALFNAQNLPRSDFGLQRRQRERCGSRPRLYCPPAGLGSSKFSRALRSQRRVSASTHSSSFCAPSNSLWQTRKTFKHFQSLGEALEALVRTLCRLQRVQRDTDRVFRGISLTVPSSHPNPLGWRHRTTTLKRPSLRPTSIAY